MDNVAKIKNDRIDMELNIKIKNKEYNVKILEEGSIVKVIVGKNEYVFNSDKKEETLLSQSTSKSLQKEIKASLAGTISEIFIKDGGTIKVGQKLLTLSAMKMENEIASESKGKIKKILVNKNDTVKAGDILIALE
ncbi:MAG: biotin/lipoyl-binding protein [Candidatus Pacebacteria bacterium]|nr:biotin/lipoyl-binding protein [Candidatus Paceibacterota bacterium]